MWLKALKHLAIFGAVLGAPAAHAATYPAMAPHDQYLMDRAAEVAMARSAAPPSISDDATVLVLGSHGFETAEKGTGQFTCLVERSWDNAFGDAEFWNPKTRGPVCMNAVAVRTALPALLERAEWALSGLSQDQMRERAKTAPGANMTPAAGAMSFMLSKEQYLGDEGQQWHPHVMFFSPAVDLGAWGAGMKGSPVLGSVASSKVTMFFIPVRKWSDGTLADYPPPAPDDMAGHHH